MKCYLFRRKFSCELLVDRMRSTFLFQAASLAGWELCNKTIVCFFYTPLLLIYQLSLCFTQSAIMSCWGFCYSTVSIKCLLSTMNHKGVWEHGVQTHFIGKRCQKLRLDLEETPVGTTSISVTQLQSYTLQVRLVQMWKTQGLNGCSKAASRFGGLGSKGLI